MSNMSYCRFQNTLLDLEDCEQALEQNENCKKELSQQEERAKSDLIMLCAEITDNYYEDEFDN